MSATEPLLCPKCGATMNRHALITAEEDGEIQEIFTCPSCGNIEARRAGTDTMTEGPTS
jgi:predicted RNA-binding Zn-ribbon protein involved in translation (DUF1610 family)